MRDRNLMVYCWKWKSDFVNSHTLTTRAGEGKSVYMAAYGERVICREHYNFPDDVDTVC